VHEGDEAEHALLLVRDAHVVDRAVHAAHCIAKNSNQSSELANPP
jgi:hypothetical protein